jgi:hypothetical protein
MRELSGAHLAQLHTFLVAARHLSFARAADELCLTASAVSHRIARLEDELALKLFQRLPRRVALTEDGERVYRSMQQAMDALTDAVQARSGNCRSTCARPWRSAGWCHGLPTSPPATRISSWISAWATSASTTAHGKSTCCCAIPTANTPGWSAPA